MSYDNRNKIKVAARKISFLMERQRIMPELKEMAASLCPDDLDKINRESPEYLLGAYEALTHLIEDLEEKDC